MTADSMGGEPGHQFRPQEADPEEERDQYNV